MFSMSRWWEKFFFILSFITQGSSYLSPHAYGILHRMHHAFADTKKDVHSPKYDRSIWSMMWRTKIIYSDIYHGHTKPEAQFTDNVPEWWWFERIANSWMARLFWAACYIAFYVFFATHWWMYLLLPIHFLMGPVHGAIINWFAHKYGYVNFKVEDTSKNMLPIDVLMMGEGYHNNHHKDSTRANFGGIRWHELDPVYPIILLLNKVGVIKLR